jgi:hypothetical protein
MADDLMHDNQKLNDYLTLINTPWKGTIHDIGVIFFFQIFMI